MGADLDTLTASTSSDRGRLRVDIEELPRWRRRLSLVVPPDRVREERGRVTRDYAKRLRLPGFRPGRAPADLVRQRFKDDIEQDLVRALIRSAVQEAVEEHRLEPIAPPVVRSLDLDAGDTLRATAELDVRPRVSLGRYRGFALERPAATVPADAVDRVLERLREERAELRTIERAAARGDVVTVEVTPLEGEAGGAQTYEILLGSGRADLRVEEQLEGVRPGEERVLALEDAAPGEPAAEAGRIGEAVAPPETGQARGEPAAAGSTLPPNAAGPRRFRVLAREVKERVLPALDDAFAVTVSKAANLAELRERLAANLAEEAAARSEHELRDRLLDAIAEANQVEVPESMVQTYVERMLHPEGGEAGVGGARGAHSHAGHSHSGHAHDHEPGEAGEEHDRLAELLRPAAERGLRRHLIVDAVARAEGLEPTEEQIDAYLGERIAQGGSVPEARRALERKGQLEDLRHHLRTENVFAYLKSQSTIRPADGSAPAEPTV